MHFCMFVFFNVQTLVNIIVNKSISLNSSKICVLITPYLIVYATVSDNDSGRLEGFKS